jgi:hypothetical protein
VIGDDGDVIMRVGEEDVYDSFGDRTGNCNSGVGSSLMLYSGSTFHVYPRRDQFYSFQEVFGGTVTLVDGSILSVVGVGAIRFQMWDGMIRTVFDVRHVPDVQRSLVSLSELDSRWYEL